MIRTQGAHQPSFESKNNALISGFLFLCLLNHEERKGKGEGSQSFRLSIPTRETRLLTDSPRSPASERISGMRFSAVMNSARASKYWFETSMSRTDGSWTSSKTIPAAESSVRCRLKSFLPGKLDSFSVAPSRDHSLIMPLTLSLMRSDSCSSFTASTRVLDASLGAMLLVLLGINQLTMSIASTSLKFQIIASCI